MHGLRIFLGLFCPELILWCLVEIAIAKKSGEYCLKFVGFFFLVIASVYSENKYLFNVV